MLSSLKIQDKMQNMEDNEHDTDEHLNVSIQASMEAPNMKESLNSQSVIGIVDPKKEDFEAVASRKVESENTEEVSEVMPFDEEDDGYGWGKNEIFSVLAAIILIIIIGYGVDVCYFKQIARVKEVEKVLDDVPITENKPKSVSQIDIENDDIQSAKKIKVENTGPKKIKVENTEPEKIKVENTEPEKIKDEESKIETTAPVLTNKVQESVKPKETNVLTDAFFKEEHKVDVEKMMKKIMAGEFHWTAILCGCCGNCSETFDGNFEKVYKKGNFKKLFEGDNESDKKLQLKNFISTPYNKTKNKKFYRRNPNCFRAIIYFLLFVILPLTFYFWLHRHNLTEAKHQFEHTAYEAVRWTCIVIIVIIVIIICCAIICSGGNINC